MKIENNRIEKIRDLLSSHQLDAVLLFSDHHDSRYSQWCFGIVPLLFHYVYVLPEEYGVFEISYLMDDVKAKIFNDKIKIRGLIEDEVSSTFDKTFKNKRVGIAGPAPFNHFSKNINILDLTPLIDELLISKNLQEIRLIKRNVKLLMRLFDTADILLKHQLTEKEIARKLKIQALKDADDLSFPICVTSGKNLKSSTASMPTSKRIIPGDGVCIDMGIKKDGFNSDCTRMFFVENKEHKGWYQNLVTRHREVIKSLKPKMKLKTIPNRYAKRDKNFEMNELEVQDLGHSIGFGLHEPPMIYTPKYANSSLQENMVFTLEPEFTYRDYKFRVEDMIWMSKIAPHILTK